MDTQQFWDMIERTKAQSGGDQNKQQSLLIDELAALDVPEIIAWKNIFDAYQQLSRREKLWAAAYIIQDWCSGDGFDYFRAWLTAQGKDVFMTALANPESLVNVKEVWTGHSSFEVIAYAPGYAYNREMNLGRDDINPFYDALKRNPMSKDEISAIAAEITYAEGINERWEPATLRSLLPRLYDKAHDIQTTNRLDDTPSQAVFLRKARNIHELRDAADHRDERQMLNIHKSYIVSHVMYYTLSEHLLFDWRFARENAGFAFDTDKKTWNCVLLCTANGKEGICISPEGHEYPGYAAYVPDLSKLNLQDVPAEFYAPETELADIQRFVNHNQENLTVTQTQKLLCGIGEILAQTGGDHDQYYLFSHNMGGFAGFCGEPIGVKDINGAPLYVGDMTCLNGNPDKLQLVFCHSTGDPFPTAEYVQEAGVTRLAGWQESMMYLRSRDFDVYSCRDDYRMSRQLASRMNTRIPYRSRSGR